MSLTLTRRYNIDRFGYLIPHRYGNLPMLGAVATYCPGEGRFCGAVAVEEGTTNLWTNPGWLDGTRSGWSAYSTDGATGERQVVPDGRFGYALRLTKVDSGAGRWGVSQNKTWHSTGSVIADSVYVKVLSAQPGAKLLLYSDYLNINSNARYGRGFDLDLTTMTIQARSNGARHLTLTPVGDGWYRVEFVTNDDDIVRGASYFWIEGAPAEVLLAYSQKEAKPFPTSFVDGTRAAGRLSYPKSLIAGLNALTVAAWTSGPPYWVSGTKYLVAAQTSGTNPHGDVFALQQNASNNIRLWVRNDANSSTVVVVYDNVWYRNWHLIVGVINKSPEPGRQPVELYVDGELVASYSNVNVVPDLSNIDETWGVQVGNWRGALHWNGLIDELLILPYAASEEEISSWYEAQGPLPPHPQALLQWDWQTVRPAQMVKL